MHPSARLLPLVIKFLGLGSVPSALRMLAGEYQVSSKIIGSLKLLIIGNFGVWKVVLAVGVRARNTQNANFCLDSILVRVWHANVILTFP